MLLVFFDNSTKLAIAMQLAWSFTLREAWVSSSVKISASSLEEPTKPSSLQKTTHGDIGFLRSPDHTRFQARMCALTRYAQSWSFEGPCRSVNGRGSAKAPLRCGRRSPQGLCSLRGGCWKREEESVEDKEGVPVVGVIK